MNNQLEREKFSGNVPGDFFIFIWKGVGPLGNLDDKHLSPEEIDLLVNGLTPGQSADQVSDIGDQDAGKIAVQPAQFPPFEQNDEVKQIERSKLELLYDVPLQFTVELGRTEKTLKEILGLGPGSIIELEKSAGEPLGILVNGKLVAKGEVIIIDENYGIRIKGILNAEERLNNINS
jgi:flagellar motor switch protein FliN